MPLTEGQVQVRGLVMGRGTAYKMLEFNPHIRTVRADQSDARAWGDGTWSGVEWADEVVVPMRIRVLGTDAATWFDLDQDLKEAFAPIGQEVQDVELRWMLGGREVVMFGRPRMVDPDVPMLGTGQTYTKAAFVALTPAIFDGVETVVTGIGLPTFTGGLTIPGSAILNSNTGFETDILGWFGFRCALSRSTVQAHSGVASVFVEPDGTGTADVGQTDAASVTPGETYSWSAWVYSPAGFGQMTLALQWKDAGGATLADREFDVVAVPAGVWTKLHATDEAPALSVTVTPKVRIKSPTTADTFYVDDAWFRSDDHGLTVPFTVTGVAADGFAALTNEGKQDTGLILRLDGPVSEPSVTLERADGSFQRLEFDTALTTGQWLDVDTKNRVVLLNGTSSRRGEVSGDWPILPPGTHTLRWSARQFNDVAELSARFRSAWR